MPQLVGFFREALMIAIGSIIGSILFLWLGLISGRGYTVEDTEAHASSYAEIIKEGHGGMTAFLWLSFAGFFFWTIYYLLVHWREFLVIFAAIG